MRRGFKRDQRTSSVLLRGERKRALLLAQTREVGSPKLVVLAMRDFEGEDLRVCF